MRNMKLSSILILGTLGLSLFVIFKAKSEGVFNSLIDKKVIPSWIPFLRKNDK